MGIKCGIVGLPNVGKSTLFNALTKAGIAAANFPFCTIPIVYEGDEIRACAGPGLAPEIVSKPSPAKIRATRPGRLVLNAVVAKLARGFVPAAA